MAKRVGMKAPSVQRRLRKHPGYRALLERRAGSPARHRHERNFAAHELELLLRAAAAAP